jgi:peptidoglycan/xylan/chitin deacetylase (PgdA/CDA1 family)
MMRLVIPAGRARLRSAAVAGVLILGWLSGLGPKSSGVPDSAVASGRPAGPVSRHGPGNATRPKRPPRPQPPKVDCRVKKCVALTFDDGPGPYTTKLLSMLAARRVRVTFFLIGGNIRGREGIVRQELAQGHAIGDHTWSHPDLSTLPKQAVGSQLTRTLREITKVTGGPTPLMRPPYGATDKRVGKVARTLGLAQILWSVDTNDWLDRDSAIVARRAIKAHRGDIILMHDIHPTTVNAVPRILRGLAQRGFTFVTVPELLAAHPLKPGKVYYDEG